MKVTIEVHLFTDKQLFLDYILYDNYIKIVYQENESY
jgi:hypothetical protein